VSSGADARAEVTIAVVIEGKTLLSIDESFNVEQVAVRG